MRRVKEYANAKINLFLDVIAKSDNGFHDIKTVMHSLNLYDTVTVSVEPSKEREINLYCKSARYIPNDIRNLAYKAAALFLEKANVNVKVNIRLEKHIPIAAGLAGGSSNAAAVLRALNRLLDRPFSQKMLYKIAAELGSDVPYCLYGKTALCEGRGEIMTKLTDKLSLFCVVALANERMSTPVAYERLDEKFSNFDGSVTTNSDELYRLFMDEYKKGGDVSKYLYNIFEGAVFDICVGAKKIRNRLLELGAKASLMSGSGPSVYGVFESSALADAATKMLRREGYTAFSCRSI